jgi:hypothetical protein
MRFKLVIALVALALPASAQYAGMPGCDGGTPALCEAGEGMSHTDGENLRAYNAQLSTAGAHTDGANCSAGQYPLGVSAGNAVQSCTVDDDVPESGDFGAAAGLDATGAVDVISEGVIPSAIARDTELAAKSAATSTTNAIPKFSDTAGDLTNSGVLIDGSNNVTVPGSLTTGNAGDPSCLILRDSDDAGDTACEVLNGAFDCEIDTNGVCGDAT